MNGVFTGVRNMVFALMNADGTYQTPEKISASIGIDVKAIVAKGRLYGDNRSTRSASKVTGYTITMESENLPLPMKSKYLGHTYQNGKELVKNTDVAPYCAIGFEFTKDNGTTRYVWYYKCKLSEPDEKAETENENINYQTATVVADVVSDDNGNYKFTMDSDETGFDSSLALIWYNAVQQFTIDSSALTVTTIPADNATGVAVGSAITVTFNKTVNVATLKNMLLVDTTANQKALSYTVDAAGKVVTITPTSALTAATIYYLILNNISDTSGIAMAYTKKKFTTT